MATAAKAAMAYPRPFWRGEGHTGNAWVTHPQAVLAEVFDASPPSSRDASAGAALAGFVALGVQGRQTFRAGLPMLIESQFAMLFGLDAQGGEQHRHDWADERWTCSPLDRAEDGTAASHPRYGDAGLDQPLWQGRLLLGGSETARQGGGYLEGALSAAARLRRQLADIRRVERCTTARSTTS
jgi:monoamine oxidase